MENKYEALFAEQPPASRQDRLKTAMQSAPVDNNYGVNGYANLEVNSTSKHSMGFGVVESRIHKNTYYTATLLSDVTAVQPASFIHRLDQDGNVDSGFTISIDPHAKAPFVPLQVIDDAEGKILCLGFQRAEYRKSEQIWRFDKDGNLDMTFAGKGFIDTDQLLGGGRFYQLIAHTTGYLIACRKDNRVRLASLNSDGTLNEHFGQGGFVYVGRDTDEEVSPVRGLATMGNKILAFVDYPSMRLACFNEDGSLDTDFAQDGYYTAASETHYQGFSVNDTHEAITLYGFNFAPSDNPELMRLDSKGQPIQHFNGGEPVRFDFQGSFYNICEYKGRLVGWALFDHHFTAVSVTLEGKLDTTFVPEDGYGWLNDFLPAFRSSLAFNADTNRMLVSGKIRSANDRAPATVAAISYN